MAKAAQRLATSLSVQVPKLTSQAVQWSRPRLSKFWYYARQELTPPSPGDIPAISKGISDIVAGAQTGRWAQLTVKEAWVNTLVCVEVAFWFFIGEQIGRRSFIGYNIKGDFVPKSHL